mmetsp:Transcript_3227/g.7531  ORF Transcript_3227/g.7531 Transcript_3227/m.7531 type:complete len:592 (-) Transcript_3227:144-1919(-)
MSSSAPPGQGGGSDEKIPRSKLIKLCRKLQQRVKTVEGKHASVVKKFQGVKAEADSAKAKVLELQAQIDDMGDKLHTQTQLMQAMQRQHSKQLRSKASNSPRSRGEGTRSLKVAPEVKRQVEKLKMDLLEARAAPSPEQEARIKNLEFMVDEFKAKALKAVQYGGKQPQEGENSENVRLRQEVAQLLEQVKQLRTGGSKNESQQIAILSKQLLSVRRECATLRAENGRLSSAATSAQQEINQLRNGESDETGRVLLAQQEELSREKEVWTQQLARQKDRVRQLERKLKEAEQKESQAKEEVKKTDDLKREAESKVGEYAVQVEALQQQLQEREQMNAELMEGVAEAKHDHERRVAEVESRSEERYNRLLAEFKTHRTEVKATLRDKEASLMSTEKELKRLRDQIATGKPGERRIFELAELQARREHKIRQVSDQMKSHVQIIEQHREAIAVYRAKIQSLTEELEAERLSKKRSLVNLDYLKAIMVKFMQLKDDSQAQVALYPVIAKVLVFSEEEEKMVRELMREKGIYSYVTSYIWPGQEANGLMKDAPPVIINDSAPTEELSENSEGEKSPERNGTAVANNEAEQPYAEV